MSHAGKLKFAGFLKNSAKIYRRSKQLLGKKTTSQPAELQRGEFVDLSSNLSGCAESSRDTACVSHCLAG